MKKAKRIESPSLQGKPGSSGGAPAGTAGLCLCLLLAAAMPARSQGQAEIESTSTGPFTLFEAPGAENTTASSINPNGAITGDYSDTSDVDHGFVRAADGTITDFDAPGAGKGAAQGTTPLSINAGGQIAGSYTDAGNVYHGFVRAAGGRMVSFDAPGAGRGAYQGTLPQSINLEGAIAGSYIDASNVYHGFVRAADGALTGFDAGTTANSINEAGVIAGSDGSHGFVRAADGTISEFDAPGATQGTDPSSINEAGEIAGYYKDANSVFHGFVRAADGEITDFDAPGAGKARFAGTTATSVNAAGVIVGYYLDASLVIHGFVRAADGAITRLDAPGTGVGTPEFMGTSPLSINAEGDIVGEADKGVFYGFVFVRAMRGTTTTLKSSRTQSVYGEPVTITVSVVSASGAPPNGELVYLMDGNAELGTRTLSGDTAHFTTAALPVGSDSITAVYGGDLNFSGSTSKALIQKVGKASSKTMLTSKPNPASLSQSVTFTATVTGQFEGTPRGKVTFSDGGKILGTISLSKGVATFSTSGLTAGKHTITAAYSGGTDFAASARSLSETVK